MHSSTAPRPFKRREWTTLEVRLFKQLYPNTPNSQLAAQLKRTVSSVTSKAHNLSLHKSEAFFLSLEACRFTKASSMARQFEKSSKHFKDDQEKADARHHIAGE